MSTRLLPLLLTVLLVWMGTGTRTVYAATHVNISIGSQAATDPADVTYVDGQAPAELRAGPLSAKYHHHQSDFSFHSDSNNNDANGIDSGSGAAAKLRSSSDQLQSSDYENSQTSARFSHGRHHSGSSANLKDQNRQNQEFERYIQNYHSGPTVETVFESSAPSSSSSKQRQKSISSSSQSKSQRLVASSSNPTHVHTFERQIAATLLPPTDDRQPHTLVSHQQPKVFNLDGASSSSAATSSSGGYDQSGFPYGDDDIQAQYPPSVDESQFHFGSHGDGSFYNGGGSTPAPGYLPSYPRPVVTKTIQIAQPALKAKKFEIRHPAVQKEFYDIEERVVIKPAGTIVVELERPVAKIPKGETVLPLGHPHPAVASAYNTNGAAIVQTMGSDVVNSGHANNQYSPSPVYSPNKGTPEVQYPQHPVIGSTTIGSAITTTPSDESISRDEFVEASLNKQFNGDSQYITTTDRNYVDEKQSNDGFYVTTTETNRNYGGQFYSRDETDRRYSPAAVVGHVELKNNGASGVSTTFSGSKQYGSSSPTLYQPSYNDNNQFKGEFFSGEFYNHQQASKPARLQEQPHMRSGQTAQIIKHENNIHIAPSQHTIYLNSQKKEPTSVNARSELRSQTRSGPHYNEEAAHVLELKPYLKHHPGAVVVYAPAAVRQSSTSSFNDHYSQPQRSESEFGRYAVPQEQHHHSNAFNNVKYSAPYTSMRYYSDQSPRYVYGGEYKYGEKANLVEEGTKNIESNTNTISTQTQQAHIQVQVPHHPQEAGKPIVVTSAINPSVHQVDTARSSKYRQTATDSYISDRDTDRDADAERFAFSADYRNAQKDNNNNIHTGDNVSLEKSSRIVESGSPSADESNTASLQPGTVEINLKTAAGHAAPGSRVIAAAPAPTDAAAASESFHKRRIVVNHPFQTVREVVEHEPITNYHHVQVNEPASPELYHHTAQYYQQDTHGALKTVPTLYHHHSTQTHGNLHYAPVVPLVHGVTVDYHHG